MSKLENLRIWIVTIFMAILILVLSIVCVAGLWQSFKSFSESQQNFNKTYTEAAAAIIDFQAEQSETDDLNVEKNEIAKISIEHLESLQVIQKNAVTNDLMSFLYSALTTVLIGLCAGFVVKSRKYCDEANENAKKSENSADKADKTATKAEEIIKTAEEAISDAENTAKSAKVTVEAAKDTAEDVNKKLAEMQENAKLSIDSLNKANEIYNTQKSITAILGIHIEIIHARAELQLGNRIATNERIFNIYNLISLLPENNDKKSLANVQKEILKLYTQINEYVEKLDLSNEEKASRKQAADIYKRYMDKAIKLCETKLG